MTVFCTVENQNLANSHPNERGNIGALYVWGKLCALNLIFMSITGLYKFGNKGAKYSMKYGYERAV